MADLQWPCQLHGLHRESTGANAPALLRCGTHASPKQSFAIGDSNASFKASISQR
jgi:hypothetical protein